MYLVFTRMPGGVAVGESGLCCCVPYLLSIMNSLCLWNQGFCVKSAHLFYQRYIRQSGHLSLQNCVWTCLLKVLRLDMLIKSLMLRSLFFFFMYTPSPFAVTKPGRVTCWRGGEIYLNDLVSEDGRRCGRQRKCWMEDIKERTSLPVPKLLTRAFR